MAYATTTDIASEFKGLTFTSTSALTDTEVAAFITQEEAIINTTIANRYEIPVTGTSAIEVMKSISIAYVAYRVAKTLNLKKDLPIPKEMIPQALNEGSKFRISKKQLEDIQTGKLVLNDAVARSLGQGVEGYNSDNGVCPIWHRDTKQW